MKSIFVSRREKKERLGRETAHHAMHLAVVKNSGHMPGGDGMAYVIEKGFSFLCQVQ